MPPSKLIFIPRDWRAVPLPQPPTVSPRLGSLLQRAGLTRFGDLHKLSLTCLARLPGCGRKALQELIALIHGAQAAANSQPQTCSRLCRDLLSVPPASRDLNPFALPLSPQAATLLQGLGALRLRDLHGVSCAHLRHAYLCGPNTIRELRSLLRRAQHGEFDVLAQAPLTPPALLAYLDALLLHLPRRHLEVLVWHLGTHSAAAASPGALALHFGISRPRVYQILRRALQSLLRLGAPHLADYVRHFFQILHDPAAPLTPQRLARSLPDPWARPRPPAFYLRLVTELLKQPPPPAPHLGHAPASIRRPTQRRPTQQSSHPAAPARLKPLVGPAASTPNPAHLVTARFLNHAP